MIHVNKVIENFNKGGEMKRYTVTKKFTTGVLKGMTTEENTNILFIKGEHIFTCGALCNYIIKNIKSNNEE